MTKIQRKGKQTSDAIVVYELPLFKFLHHSSHDVNQDLEYKLIVTSILLRFLFNKGNLAFSTLFR